MNKKSPSKTPHLSLHRLIVTVSYWGTTARALLFTFLIGTSMILRLVNNQALDTALPLVQALAGEMYLALAALTVYIIFDAGYVTIAKAYPMRSWIDKGCLFVESALLAAIYIAPYYLIVSDWVGVLILWLPLIVLFLLALRLIKGVVFGKRVR